MPTLIVSLMATGPPLGWLFFGQVPPKMTRQLVTFDPESILVASLTALMPGVNGTISGMTVSSSQGC